MVEGPRETERIVLSQEERDRLQVLRELEQGRLKQVATTQQVRLRDRQVRRLLRASERMETGRGRPTASRTRGPDTQPEPPKNQTQILCPG